MLIHLNGDGDGVLYWYDTYHGDEYHTKPILPLQHPRFAHIPKLSFRNTAKTEQCPLLLHNFDIAIVIHREEKD